MAFLAWGVSIEFLTICINNYVCYSLDLNETLVQIIVSLCSTEF